MDDSATAMELWDFSEQAWSPSPTEAPGCFSKHFRRADGFKVVLVRLDAGAEYPAFVVPNGADYYVVDGRASLNGTVLSAGSYARVPSGGTAHARSDAGCVVLCLYPPAGYRHLRGGTQ
ncbi:MAG: hypothetical protein GW892_04595 [Armatimonadetes bacterium]|nr:hypothetical protein [Armatimonadota bacterium]NCO90255.1 hypothetical protein [Armatimonadota bacterium]NCP28580.1 hypothetical protein [Armatimonadota bacterium]PIU88041.1 MAG: hypothetical protein COS65_31675 [Armatimonadetes bacterium CG06_land_8_20_14_3_00_66_21]PIX37327.1 MAG: hypothetical protein COZ57_34830 [Armatimonadetes bacterium CG_4_8_14_3_um_filter_66_20]